jgi:CHAT domain-containing protein
LALERGIQAFEQERATLVDEGRASARDAAWGLFEAAVHIAIQKKDYERAFALSERARVRTLAEARKLPATRSLQGVQATLRADEAILALNQFEDELAIWMIRRDGFEVVTSKLSRTTAERLVMRQQHEVWQQSNAQPASRALFNEIIRPVARRLAGVNRLVIVPDTTYEDASFAAMSDSTSGRFLAETMTLNLAPSANAFATVRERPAMTTVSGPLVFGGAGDAATRQAIAIAEAYRSSSVLVGSAATKSRFFAAAQLRPAVHIAVPVTRSTSNPLLSRAMVADEPGARHSGVMFGSDIASSAFATNLVVIEEVQNGRTNRGEGTLSMARAFMAAGVPAVIGTLPGADENATRDLMISFHREMSKGVSAEQALQTVQRRAIQQNGRRVGAWSALVMYGSDR